MNLTTDQLIFLAGIIKQMTEGSNEHPETVVYGKFALELEWRPKVAGQPEGQYVLRGIHSREGTR